MLHSYPYNRSRPQIEAAASKNDGAVYHLQGSPNPEANKGIGSLMSNLIRMSTNPLEKGDNNEEEDKEEGERETNKANGDVKDNAKLAPVPEENSLALAEEVSLKRLFTKLLSLISSKKRARGLICIVSL